MKLIEQIYKTFVRICDQLQSPFLLLVRCYWGWQLMQTGWGKVGDLGKVTNFFMSLGIPLPGVNAVFVSGLELVGGLLLMVGLASRPISFLIVFDMLVAYITADREAFFSFLSSPDKFAAAAPFVFLLACLIVLIFGPGQFSIDALLGKRVSSFIATKTPTAAEVGRA